MFDKDAVKGVMFGTDKNVLVRYNSQANMMYIGVKTVRNVSGLTIYPDGQNWLMVVSAMNQYPVVIVINKFRAFKKAAEWVEQFTLKNAGFTA